MPAAETRPDTVPIQPKLYSKLFLIIHAVDR